MSDAVLPNDQSEPPSARADPEPVSGIGIAAMQGDDGASSPEVPPAQMADQGDAYRRLLENQIEAQTARLSDFADDPDNSAALKADLQDTNSRLDQDLKLKYGLDANTADAGVPGTLDESKPLGPGAAAPTDSGGVDKPNQHPENKETKGEPDSASEGPAREAPRTYQGGGPERSGW